MTTPKNDAREMVCPRCNVERADYEAGPGGGAYLDRCPNCGSGLPPAEQLDEDEIDEIIARHDVCCDIARAAKVLRDELRYARKRADPCAECWHLEDTHGDHPLLCYACDRLKLTTAAHAFK